MPVASIHAKMSDPPRLTMFVRRPVSRNDSMVRRFMPAWMVTKSTPSSACARTTSRKSSAVMSTRAFSK